MAAEVHTFELTDEEEEILRGSRGPGVKAALSFRSTSGRPSEHLASCLSRMPTLLPTTK